MKTSKKKKRKRLYWLLADLAVAVIILSLLLYKPARYHRPKLIYDGRQSTYLTHELLAQIYNRAQEGEPFEQEIAQDGIDGIITHSRWPKDAGGASFLAPTVLFEPEGIVLIGPVLIRGIELVVTVILKPSLDEEGLLRLRVEKIRIGAINVTPVAAAVAKKMYRERAAQMPLDMDDVRTQIVASLLTGEPFEPVFDVYDSKVRIEKITLERERIVLRLVPVFR